MCVLVHSIILHGGTNFVLVLLYKIKGAWKMINVSGLKISTRNLPLLYSMYHDIQLQLLMKVQRYKVRDNKVTRDSG